MSRNGMRLAAWLGIAAVMVLGLLPATGQAKTTKPPTKTKTTKTKTTKTKTTKATAAVREIPVSFSVVNSNATSISCHTDGKTYTIVGTLFLPKGATPSGVTLYAHGLGYAGYFWDFSAVPGYNYVAYEADHGHASVIIDRLGYGASGKPEGNASCIGGQATVLHEIISELRSGNYSSTGTTHPTFSRIGLVGHSVGAEIAEVEAYSFGDIQALGMMDFDDGDYSVGAYGAFAADVANCGMGGRDQSSGGPGGYSPFGATVADYDGIMFNNTDPAVEKAANALRSVDPCGDVTSVLQSASVSLTKDGSINVPIAYLWGQDDALFPKQLPWASVQEKLYTASPKVTNFEIPGSGHAVTLEKSAPTVQKDMDGWLSANGL